MRIRLAAVLYYASALLLGTSLIAQPVPPRKEFLVGAIRALQEVPAGRLRDQIARLPAGARGRAIAWLGNIHFTELDLKTLQVDTEGGIYFVDEVPPGAIDPVAENATVETSSAAVPVSPLPSNLVFHSKPGAPNVIYLNFSGETVMNTAWNDSLGRSSIPAVAFSKDSDLTTFSDTEQLAIRRIWQRVAEDYAPFDVDVTTERPGTFTTRTAHALITRNTDADGLENPAATSGGVAYVGVFATFNFAEYRPAWIYGNNLGGDESFIAEAVSHEIGHNLGLTHDGKTDGSDYYGGHGSGETSWGPLMGTGYNRNVSHWCKGDYYLANNTQDDLATIASKMAYRTDDHAGTFGSATPLSVSSSGIISATTPETDPANASTANKGRIERTTDADVFSFTTGAGTISISVEPWIVPSGYTRGGNIDLHVELHNASGQLLLVNNAPDRTGTIIQTNLAQGVYYLTVKNSAADDPMSSSPSGYSSYGSVGQYFVTGSVIANTIVLPPGAELAVTDITDPGVATKSFSVIYSDDVAVEVATIGNGDIRVTGANGYDAPATFVSVDLNSNGSPRTATYSIAPPSSVWTENDTGTYTVSILNDAVSDTQGAFVPAGVLGTFQVAVPRTIYFADMNTNPGWSFGGLWQYGLPAYALGGGPLSAYTGLNIVGYNLTGNYENLLSAIYATTPMINSSGASSVTLQFRRWLRVRSNDTADIQISTNGTSWTDLWSNNGSTVADSAWQLVQYSLPAGFAGSPSLQLRWGMASGQSQNDIGWNIDDVALLGNGVLDTTAPTAELSVANITSGGSPGHSFAVTYS
ncbi:MAG: zinc-dependent metalloprotease, partial [Limisphaerales bacterium]